MAAGCVDGDGPAITAAEKCIAQAKGSTCTPCMRAQAAKQETDLRMGALQWLERRRTTGGGGGTAASGRLTPGLAAR